VDQTVASGAIVTLTATATDAEDTLVPSQASWSQVSGPATLTPPPPQTSPVWTNVAFVTPGVYVVQATWSDPRGLTGTDTKQVTVNAGGGAGNMAAERLGVFARTGYSGDGAGPRPTITKTADGAVAFVQSYWEADGLAATCVRELIDGSSWNAWRTNVGGYLPKYKVLCQSPRTTVMLWACPMISGDEFTSTHESMRQAYIRGANGAYINAGHWTFLRDTLKANGYGVTFPVWIDPCSEYDLGNPNTYPNNVGAAGRMNWGRMRDGAACVRRFYEYLKEELPLLEFGTCRISAGGTSKYMNINNAVETFGGQFPQGLDMSAALLFELNRQKAPLSSWFSWLAVNMYQQEESQQNVKWAETLAAVQQYGIATGVEEFGVGQINIQPDNLETRNFIDRKRDQYNLRPASGPGSLKFCIYFEGYNPSCLYNHYPNALAHFVLTSVFGS
jgi:hypothetical protein